MKDKPIIADKLKANSAKVDLFNEVINDPYLTDSLISTQSEECLPI
jgi:hypothetical protein